MHNASFRISVKIVLKKKNKTEKSLICLFHPLLEGMAYFLAKLNLLHPIKLWASFVEIGKMFFFFGGLVCFILFFQKYLTMFTTTTITTDNGHFEFNEENIYRKEGVHYLKKSYEYIYIYTILTKNSYPGQITWITLFALKEPKKKPTFF